MARVGEAFEVGYTTRDVGVGLGAKESERVHHRTQEDLG